MTCKSFCSLLKAAILLIGSFFFADFAFAQSPMIFSPFAAGTTMRVSQTNNDTPSHNGNLAYAYDFVANSGATLGVNLYAPANGVIEQLACGHPDNGNGSNGGWGNSILLKVVNGYSYIYVRLAHLQQDSCNHLEVGDFVEQGALVGRIGNSGNSTGAHLHIQVAIYQGGVEVSIPFNFVEKGGTLGLDTRLTSRLRRDTIVIDNTGRFNAGVDFVTNPVINFSGSWTNYTSTSAKVIQGGHRKALSPNSTTNGTWQFKVLATANYHLHVTCLENASNTSQARYMLAQVGSLFGGRTYYVDQTRAPSSTRVGYTDTYTLGTPTLVADKYYTVSATRGNTSGALCVDALFIMME